MIPDGMPANTQIFCRLIGSFSLPNTADNFYFLWRKMGRSKGKPIVFP